MKKTTVFGIQLASMLLFLFFASYSKAQDINVKVSNIRSPKGQIILEIFKDEASYDKEEPYKKLMFDKKALVNGTLAIHFELLPGIYGITMIDDENSNGKIDKNMIRMPKEGFGFSNFFMTKMKKPSFEDFKVDLHSPATKIEIKVKYM